jgi:hypothetical protein
MSTEPPAPASTTAPPSAAFDRTALAILGTMLTLIVMLTALLVTVSAPTTTDPSPTAQTSGSPHRA